MSDQTPQPTPAPAPAPAPTPGINPTPSSIPTPTPPANDWRESLPEDLRKNPALQKFSNVEGVAKSYIEIEKDRGLPKVNLPQDGWTDEQWNEYHSKTGRPEKATDYKFEKPQLPEGFVHDEVLDKKFADWAHKSGLSKKAAGDLRNQFLTDMVATETVKARASQEKHALALADLERSYGDKWAAHIEGANNVIAQVGGADFKAFLQNTYVDGVKLGNHPMMAKFMIPLGERLAEGRMVNSGNFSGAVTGSASQALQEINQMNQEAMKTPGYWNVPGNRARQAKLFQVAYPS